MEPVSRKVVYRLYPSRSQEAALLDMLGLHQRLYNAALEQRIAAWRLQRKSLSAYDQMRVVLSALQERRSPRFPALSGVRPVLRLGI